MAVPTDPPYCLVCPNIYSTTVPHEDRHHFNIQGGPPRLHTHACVCQTLLQHANLSEAHRQKYYGSCLVISWGVQYSCLPPKSPCHTTTGCDSWTFTQATLSLVPVGDFQLEDSIFPGMPGDSLLNNSEDLAKLHRLRFQVTTHRMEQTSAVKHEEEKSQSSYSPGEMPSLTSKNGKPSKSRGRSPQVPSPEMTTNSLNRKSSHCNKHSPPAKEHHESHNKDSHSSKH